METKSHSRPRVSREKAGRLLEGAGWALGLFFLWVALRFSVNLVIDDDWRFFAQVAGIAESPGTQWREFFVRYNHSLVALLRLLYLACFEWFGGDTRSLSAINLACLVAAFLGFRSALKRGIPDPAWRGALVFWIALVCFSFTAWYVVPTAWGVQWTLMPGLLGIALALDGRGLSRGATVAAYFVFALAGSMTMAHGLLLWIVLPVLIVRRFGWNRGAAAWWAAGAALCFALEFQPGSSESWEIHQPRLSESLGHPFALAEFVFALSGGVAAQVWESVPLAALLGASLIGAFLGCLFLVWRHRGAVPELDGAVPWLAVALFYVLAAGLISVGRFPYGIDRAISKHYVEISLGLSLAVVVLVVQVVVLAPAPLRAAPDYRRLRPALLGVAILAVALHLAALPPSLLRFLREWEGREARVAQYALDYVVPTEERVMDFGPSYPAPQKLEAWHLLTLLSRAEVDERTARARAVAGRGEWGGWTTLSKTASGETLKLGGAAECTPGDGPFRGLLVVLRFGDGAPEYRFRRSLRSLPLTLRRHDGHWVTGWSAEVPLPPGRSAADAGVEVYSVTGKMELAPLAVRVDGISP